MGTILARDGFTYSAPPTSGDAPFTATDNTRTVWNTAFAGTPTAGDQVDYVLTFPGGTVTFRARWSSSTTLVLECVSTLAGTSNGTTTLQTFTGTSTNKPRSTGDLARQFLTVNRGAADSSTAITFGWGGRGNNNPVTTNTLNFDGEITPTAGAFAITGSSFFNRADLEGQTPDGDGTPALALGTYARLLGAFEDRWRFGVDPDGDARPQIEAFNDLVYALQGTGIGADQAARLTVILDNDTSGSPYLAVRCSGSEGTFAAYVAIGFVSGADVEWDIYRYEGGFGSFVDLVTYTGVADGSTPHTYELKVVGEQVTLAIDGGSADVTINDTGTAVVSGDPGLGGLRNSNSVPGLSATGFEIEDFGGATPTIPYTPPPAVPTGTLASDCFTGGDDTDIQDRNLDGCGDPALDNGAHDDHPESPGTIDIVDGVAVVNSCDEAFTTVKDFTPSNDVAPGARLTVKFPNNDPLSGSPPFFLTWRYTITGNDGNPRDDGPAGAHHPSFIPIAPVDGLVSDLVAMGTGTIAGLTLENFTAWPSGQPKSFTFHCHDAPINDVEDQPVRRITFYTTLYLPEAGSHTFPGIAVSYSMADANTGGTGFYQINGRPEIPYAFDQTPGNVAPSPQPAPNPTVDPAVTSGATLSCQFSVATAIELFTTTLDEIEEVYYLTPDGNKENPGDHVTFVEGVSGTPDESATAEVLVRADPTDLTAYRFAMDMVHDSASSLPSTSYRLELLTAGVVTTLATAPLDSAPLTVQHDTLTAIELVDQGGILYAKRDGLAVFTFTIATDTPTITALTGGRPGFGLIDGACDGSSIQAVKFEVLGVSCTGDPGGNNPYPNPPPPPVARAVAFTSNGDGTWNTHAVPGEGVTNPDFHVGEAGGIITPDVALVVRDVTEWVTILPIDSDELPPPESPFPPNFDPCADLPQVIPGDVTPLALSTRIFGMSQAPASVLGSVYNGTKFALGPWTRTDLATLASLGAKLITGQGAYGQYLPSGSWNRDNFVSVAASKIAPLYSMLLDYVGLGVYVGHSIVDDWRSASLWPPSGIPEADIIWAKGQLAGTFPGIPFGIRSLTRQFSSNPGFDFMNVQFVSWRRSGPSLESATAFATAEYANALSWGMPLFLDLNYRAGGDGSSGVYLDFTGHAACSAAEVIEYYTDMYGAVASLDSAGSVLYGSLGYQYGTDLFARIPGLIDAQTTARNILAGFPDL